MDYEEFSMELLRVRNRHDKILEQYVTLEKRVRKLEDKNSNNKTPPAKEGFLNKLLKEI